MDSLDIIFQLSSQNIQALQTEASARCYVTESNTDRAKVSLYHFYSLADL